MSDLVVIREAFNKAGKLHWPDRLQELGCLGVGVDMKFFEGDGSLNIRVLDQQTTFTVDKMSARRFIKGSQSIERIGSVCLWVLPLSVLHPLDKLS